MAAVSWFSEAELAAARRANIRDHLRRGWKYADGLLTANSHSKLPTTLMPSRSGATDFNPHKDAFAVRLGAKFVRDNRYWHEGTQSYMDRNGMLVPGPDEECLECGGMPWHVKTRRGIPPSAPSWAYNLTYCPRCVSPEEVERVKAAKALEAQQQQSRGHHRRR